METNNSRNIHKEYWGLLIKQVVSFCNKNRKSLFFIVGLVILVGAVYFGFLKYNPEFSFPFGTFFIEKASVGTTTESLNSNTLDRSIFDLADEVRPGKLTSQERVNFIDKISGLQTQAEQGVIEDIGTDGLTLLIHGNSTSGSFGIIRCDFSGGWRARLSLLKKDAEIKFTGTISSYDLSQGWIVLNSCNLMSK